jgi:hypothetical protein
LAAAAAVQVLEIQRAHPTVVMERLAAIQLLVHQPLMVALSALPQAALQYQGLAEVTPLVALLDLGLLEAGVLGLQFWWLLQ